MIPSQIDDGRVLKWRHYVVLYLLATLIFPVFILLCKIGALYDKPTSVRNQSRKLLGR